MGQALISTLSLYNSAALIPTWSSNPLNTVLVLLHLKVIEHRPKRCMLSVRDRNSPPLPTMPVSHQPSLRSAYEPVKYITRLLWLLCTIIAIWAIVILVVSLTRRSNTRSFQVIFFGGVSALQLNLTAILLIVTFQAGITLGLHLAEVIVNISRDEHAWRRASSKGERVSQGTFGSIKTALLSWQTVILFVIKAVSHWLFGISIGIKARGKQMVMDWQGLVPLFALMCFLAAFTTFLTRWSSSGTQPVAFGHLQTLCDLIDVWPENMDEAMFWGDRGESSDKDVRHTGTSSTALRTVQLSSRYT
jgi:hypothetical protein